MGIQGGCVCRIPSACVCGGLCVLVGLGGVLGWVGGCGGYCPPPISSTPELPGGSDAWFGAVWAGFSAPQCRRWCVGGGVCVGGVLRRAWRPYFRGPLLWEVVHYVPWLALWFGGHWCRQCMAVLLCGASNPTMLGYPQKSGGLWLCGVCGLGVAGLAAFLGCPRLQSKVPVGLWGWPPFLAAWGPPKRRPNSAKKTLGGAGVGLHWACTGRCHPQFCLAPASPLPPASGPSLSAAITVFGALCRLPAGCTMEFGAGQMWGHAWWGVAGWGWLAGCSFGVQKCAGSEVGGQESQGAAS